MKRRSGRLLLGVLALVVVAMRLPFLLLRPVAQPKTNDLAEIFNHGSIGNEEPQGLPSGYGGSCRSSFPNISRQPGRLWHFRRLLGRGEAVPVGFSVKTLGVIPRVAPNCAFCHQGSYRLRPHDPADW